MDADERLILSLHHVEDFRVDEIAHALGIPTGTAKSRLHRARQRLKAILERSLS